jgi:ADP-ribose pyrophosphatase
MLRINFMVVVTRESKKIYAGKVFSVRQDRVYLPNGHEAHLDIVDHNGAVVIVPVDDHGNIWFVRQYRHAAGEVLLELPAGTLEINESPEASAHREIREEIGMAAGKMNKIGEFYIAPGYSTEYLHIYIAEDLSPDPLPVDDDEMITIERIASDTAYQLAEKGKIRDAKTLAALLLARSEINKLIN